jgi:hypothetical protein
VESDRVPDVLDISLADPMSAKEAGGRIGVHFETLVWASVGRLKGNGSAAATAGFDMIFLGNSSGAKREGSFR